MIYQASVSFESDTQPVKTVKLDVKASNVATAASRAIKGAKKQCPGAHFRSLVLVLEKEVADEDV